MEALIKGMKKTPYGMPMMYDAWIGCVMWATTKEEILTQFFELYPLENVSDMIMTKESSLFPAWCDWVTEFVWGEEE